MLNKLKINKTQIKRLTYRLRHDFLTINNVIIAIAAIVVLGWVWGSIEAMQRNYELQQVVDRKRQQAEIEKLQVSLLNYETKYFQSAEYIDLTMRERLGKASPGERQLVVPSTDTNEQKDQSTIKSIDNREGNFQQWINFLFGKKSNKNAR